MLLLLFCDFLLIKKKLNIQTDHIVSWDLYVKGRMCIAKLQRNGLLYINNKSTVSSENLKKNKTPTFGFVYIILFLLDLFIEILWRLLYMLAGWHPFTNKQEPILSFTHQVLACLKSTLCRELDSFHHCCCRMPLQIIFWPFRRKNK